MPSLPNPSGPPQHELKMPCLSCQNAYWNAAPPLKGIVLRQTWVYVIASWLFTSERRAKGPLVVASTTGMNALTAHFKPNDVVSSVCW